MCCKLTMPQVLRPEPQNRRERHRPRNAPRRRAGNAPRRQRRHPMRVLENQGSEQMLPNVLEVDDESDPEAAWNEQGAEEEDRLALGDQLRIRILNLRLHSVVQGKVIQCLKDLYPDIAGAEVHLPAESQVKAKIVNLGLHQS